jgi:hypothetical protein
VCDGHDAHSLGVRDMTSPRAVVLMMSSFERRKRKHTQVSASNKAAAVVPCPRI